jgi:hypothetical protein
MGRGWFVSSRLLAANVGDCNTVIFIENDLVADLLIRLTLHSFWDRIGYYLLCAALAFRGTGA